MESAWYDYRSDTGRFAVAFPASPKESLRTANTAVGAIENRIASVTRDSIAYSVAFALYPSDYVASTSTGKLLDGARDGAVSATGGNLITETLIEMDGFPGREITFSVQGGVGMVLSRFYLVESSLYQITVTSHKDKFMSENIGMFMDSFKLMR